MSRQLIRTVRMFTGLSKMVFGSYAARRWWYLVLPLMILVLRRTFKKESRKKAKEEARLKEWCRAQVRE